MDIRTFLLATGATLALAACQTTPDEDTTASASSSAPTSTATGGTWSDPDDTLHDRVHDALMEQMGPLVNDLGVKTEGSKVILTGSVKTEADKQKAHDIAHGVQGATTVDVSGLVVKP
jgi:osmotically-inducible protein OsmY